MYVDLGLQIDDELDMGTRTGSLYGTNAVDLGLAARDVGKGRQLYLAITVTEGFVDASASSGTIFSLIEDADATGGMDSGSTIVLSTESFLVGALTIGTLVILPVPPGIALQYLGVKVVVDQDLTAGIISAQIVLEAQTN